ncbi:MAG: sulfite exporter TauE/SafE family protein, partial [Eubacteriales bacterium]|nr:sulfite exporter TauE/SafE family protein [Eubacteriales bacterium]
MGYGMLFLVGLMTSVHCVAMCGGISLSQSLPGGQAQAKSSTRQALTPALLYNAGRVISYTLTGLIFGTLGMLFGAGLDTSLSVLAQAALKVVAGLLMLAMGLSLLGLFPALRRLRLRLPRLPKRLRPRAPLTVGLLNGLMPCGPLQAMQLAVLSSASPVRGALSMLAFSLGTV